MKVGLLVAAFAAISAGSQHGWTWLLVGAVIAGVLIAVRDKLIEGGRR